ncbi:unnamed protein product [Heterobilharzia americana]|nr:unnamed protein product [Heterobilharzia americana]
MEYGNTNMGGSQQIYVSQSQEPPRVSGCNPQHLANTFPGVDCNSSSRNYGPYSQPYQANEYSASHNSHIGGPPGVYQQSFSGEAHGQNLTLNQLLQQNSSSSTYQVRPVNNSQPVYRGYDPYSYTYKPGAPSCAAQGRTQANTYSFSGAQRFADPYTRSYLPYPPGPHYPYYPHSQSLIQRSRAPQPPGLDYANINSCNQSRPPQPTPSGGSTPNQIERPPSRNVSYVNSSSHAAFQNAQLSSPVYSSGSQPSSWSPHTAPFGSPQHIQSQPRPRSLSRDYQLKINEVPSESPNANNSSTNNAATRSDNQSEGTPSTFEETGCRPQSRLSETGVSSTPKSVTSSVKDQSDVPNTAPSVETVVQNPGTDGTPQPQVSTPSTIISSLSVSPLSVVSRETSPAQSYPSFMQTSVSSSSPMTSQVGNIQGQPATCPSPGQSKGPHQNSRTAPSPRPYGVVNQEMGIPRMPYPSYPHPQAPPNSPYSVSGRPPGYPAGYPLRPPSIHSATSVPSCVPGRPQFQPQSSVGPTSTSSMPPPLTLPSSSLSSNQSTACDNSGPSQTTFTQVQPYSTPMSSASTNYGTSGSAYGPHPSWDQEISYQPPHPSSAFHPQFGGRPPYLGPTDRGVGYPPSASVPNSNASNSMAHNGQNLQPSSAGPYPHNQSLSYPSHHTQYPYSQSQMAYHPQSQYNHPYSPGPGGPILQQQQHPQHMVAPTSAVASNYSSPMLNSSSPLPQHIQNSREGFHMQYPHDGQHPPVSSSNESFVSTGFPQNGGSPGVVRPSSMINAISKANLVSGKMGKNDLPTRPVSSGCPTPISSSSQIMNANQSGVASGEPNSVSVPQHYQHRLASQSSHPQIQQYPEVGNYPPGLGSGSFGPQCGAPGSSGEVLQGPSFQGFQQQYHSPSNSLIPSQQPQNVAISASNQSSFYSTDGAHSNVGSIHQSLSSISSQSLSGFQKLLEMGNEPERRPWLENYIRFMDDIGKPVVGIPQVVKQPLDLYRFYVAVRERGGVAEVIKARRWKEISQAIGISASASAAYALRKNYCKLLLDYECRFDRGGIDPRPLLAHIENQSGKKRRCSSIDGDPNSLSGDLPPPAPPSPTGSHSSASSSLLPPGSSGASLSGGPSGTAGSAASDSQLGPPSSQHQRFSDHGQPGSVSTVPESPSCIPNAPSPPGLSGQSSTSYMPSSGPTPTNVPSPQRPSSCTAINGYPNASVSTSDSSCCPWPWTPENSNSETVTHQSPSASEPSTTMPGVVLVTRESTSSQYTQSRIPSGSLPSNNNIPPASSMYAGVSNSSCTSSTPSGNIEVIAQHNFNPYLTHGPPFVSNPSHPMINQHHVPPPQAIEHPFPGSQPHMYPRHPSNHSFRTPSFNPAAPPSAVSGDSIALLRMHQLRPGAPQMQPYIPGGAVPPFCGSVNNNNTNLNHSSPIPPHLLHHSQRPGYVTTILKRLDHYTFPPDLGPIAPFKLLMALRSGLTAEVSWALNCLNILLRDENGIDLIVPSALPGLLTSLVDIWRHTLGELFDHDLFITSLELPTDLTVIPSANTDTKHDLVLKNVRNNYSSNLKTNLSYLDVKGKSYLNDETSSTSLIQLEREIGRIAAIKDVPLSSVRVGLRRLLHKCNNSRSLHPPVRLRNGLMLRVENFPTMSSVAVNLSTSCNSSSRSVDTSTPVSSLSSRSRKRGKHLLFSSTTPNYMSGSSNITSEQLHTNMSSNINISNAVSKSDGIMVWSTPQITSIVDSLRAPEAYSNLRDLALYVIDTLLESRNNHPPETSETCSASQTSDQLNPTKPTITTKSSSSVYDV